MTIDFDPPKTANIRQRKRAVQSELKYVAKDRENKHGDFLFVGHDDTTEPLHDLFVKHGIDQEVTVESCERVDVGGQPGLIRVTVEVSWINVDDPNDRIRVRSFGESVSTRKTGGPDDLQIGKAISYAVKYAHLKNFMLVGGIPDNEDRQPVDREPARNEAPPAKDPVSDDEIESILKSYSSVKTRAELDSVRKRVSPLVNANRLTRAQTDTLVKADTAAYKLVDAGQQS